MEGTAHLLAAVARITTEQFRRSRRRGGTLA